MRKTRKRAEKCGAQCLSNRTSRFFFKKKAQLGGADVDTQIFSLRGYSIPYRSKLKIEKHPSPIYEFTKTKGGVLCMTRPKFLI